MSQSGEDSAYGVARRTLIYAFKSLSSLPKDSLVLVGAHAVYLRAPEIVAGSSPFTYDGDIVVDPRRIARPRMIFDRLQSAGFALRTRHSGLYSLENGEHPGAFGGQLDVFVPEGFASSWYSSTRDSADVAAAMSQEGLELALLDHSPMQLTGIESNKSDSIVVEVAGITSLLVAKGWKIGERFRQGPEPFEEVQKDIADIYRLLKVSEVAEVEHVVDLVGNDKPLIDVTRAGARYIHDLCGRNGPGVVLLGKLIGGGREAEITLASLETLATEFFETVSARLPPVSA